MKITALITTAALTATLMIASTASAATPAVTAQAQQANAGFLAYAPTPPDGPGALCLVDTGVNPNPDTAPGLIGSYAIDNDVTSDVDPEGHGTLMAMIAGAAGDGMVGAWPQLKIVSVRATNDPSPGQAPTFNFDDYWQAINSCTEAPESDHVKVVDLALASQIPPTPDQAQSFANAVGGLESENVAVVAAAGNTAGQVEEPGAEPNVFSVGATTAQPGSLSETPAGAACNFTATVGVGILAPGCGLDAASPFTDQATCCEDGTSEASAFTAAVLVALMSYDPALSYTKAEDLLVQTATDGNLNVAAAFQADGLEAIVTAGNANTPQPPPAAPTATTPSTTTATATTPTTPTTATAPAKSATKTYPVKVTAAWRDGRISIELTGKHGRALIRITLKYRRSTRRLERRITKRTRSLTIRIRRPVRAVVQLTSGRKALSASTRVSL